MIATHSIGTTLTHHSDLEAVRADRQAAVHPFAHLLSQLGDVFTVREENEPHIELLFRFAYIYERRYKDTAGGDLRFVNEATLAMFDEQHQ